MTNDQRVTSTILGPEKVNVDYDASSSQILMTFDNRNKFISTCLMSLHFLSNKMKLNRILFDLKTYFCVYTQIVM